MKAKPGTDGIPCWLSKLDYPAKEGNEHKEKPSGASTDSEAEIAKGYKPCNCKGRRTNMGKQEHDNHSREGVKKQAERKWYSLMDKIWAKPNLEEAFKEVKRNRGAAGIDQVTIIFSPFSDKHMIFLSL